MNYHFVGEIHMETQIVCGSRETPLPKMLKYQSYITLSPPYLVSEDFLREVLNNDGILP